MKIAAGVIVLLAAILCFSSGTCNMVAAGAGTVGKSAIASGVRLLESSSGSGGITASARKALRKQGAAMAMGGSDRRALEKIKVRTAQVIQELEDASALMFGAGALAALGGLLAFAASVLLITGKGRTFIIAALVVAMAGTGLGLLTPFTVTILALAKLCLLGFGVLVGVTVREEVSP